MSWSYKREESQTFAPIPVGAYRVRIAEAEKMVSKSGKDMLKLKFDVSGQASYLYHYIVFLQDKPEITNRNLTNFFDSFKDIPEGDFVVANWIGKTGAVQIKHEEYNGSMSAKVHYFISASKQAGLPAWVEPQRADKTASAHVADLPTDANGFVSIPESVADELPF